MVESVAPTSTREIAPPGRRLQPVAPPWYSHGPTGCWGERLLHPPPSQARKKQSPLSVRQRALKDSFGVADGARTHDNRNHNPGLYQLSYSHREAKIITRSSGQIPALGRFMKLHGLWVC